MTQDQEIICEIRGAAGVVVLNRPKALNALSLGMVRELARALDAWENDPQVTRVVVISTSEKAFSAGGDIRWLHDCGKVGRYEEMLAFWGEEYILNHRIKTYPKPYVALIDGIVMGGGVGISLHGSHRIAGDRYLFAMPEVGIGFFPDVGATYALPRLADGFGRFLALTGERIGAADALSVGLATHGMPSERMAELADALTGRGALDEILAAFSLQRGPGPLQAERAVIADAFGGETLPEVIARLDKAAANGSAFAGKLLQTIATKSPTSVAIAFEQMRRGAGLDFAEAMRTEYRIVSRIARGHDFYEGVRAVVIDKDQAPRWQPATLDAVRQADIDAYFALLGADELKLEG
ncbi:enoyl-CoA hydratase/isomerase family protein [Bosea sp. F3-2]|uniref:enoyl-CoA hydratase/isomerase family protein n=1 Tax=Bosea sp. F3-2 TaxID=2599640 RepID=UPI0011EE5CFF|nr:enoyl-CoA hydratase/isomerase family protein [Bosea sp. F3-2]QEL22615.1 enoyl-CoA hydratase/isomerase family protein [Bosea sp. F3-2]